MQRNRQPLRFYFNLRLPIFYLFGWHLNLNFNIAFVFWTNERQIACTVYASFVINQTLKTIYHPQRTFKTCLLSHTNTSVWFKSCCLICLKHLPSCYCQFKRRFKSSPQRMDWLSRVMATAVRLFKGPFGSNLWDPLLRFMSCYWLMVNSVE